MAKKHTLHSIINELVDRTNTDTQRIRHLESWEKSLDMRLETIEQELLNINNNVKGISSDIESKLAERDKQIAEMQRMVKEIIKHMKGLVPKEKLGELKALVDIYDPLQSAFMTREEVEQLIDNKLSKSNK